MRIGIDIGGVIIGGGGTDTFFTKDYLNTPEVYGSFTSIKKLVPNHEIFLISKGGPLVAQKTRHWLEDRGFYDWTGVQEHNLVFCRMRRHKAPIAQLLELNLFIDDREDICKSMTDVGITAIQFDGWTTAYREIGKLHAATKPRSQRKNH